MIKNEGQRACFLSYECCLLTGYTVAMETGNAKKMMILQTTDWAFV